MHPEKQRLVLCPLPSDGRKSRTRVERERQARDYWNRLSLTQEAWVLRTMRFAKMGELPGA
jgi:hypothetical protein